MIIALYCVFTLTSIAQYPGPFSPMDNWLSDLGNGKLNPSGNIFFNVGCIVTGLSMLLMAWGLNAWQLEGKNKKLAMLAARASLTLSAIPLMLIGVFTEGTPLHGTLAITFFALLFVFLVLTNVALVGDRRYKKWIGYYAVLVMAVDLVFIYTFFAYERNTIWEWLAVFSALLWVGLLAYNMLEPGVKSQTVSRPHALEGSQ